MTEEVLGKTTGESVPQGSECVMVADCGTSSVRAFIAEIPATGDNYRILEDLSFPIELTDSFVSGKIVSPNHG